MGKGTGSTGNRAALAIGGVDHVVRDTSEEGRAIGSVVGLACGDALGFPTETVNKPWRLKKRFGLERVTEFIDHKFAGKGEYSDDTQQTLMLARCIRPDGSFDVERWADVELPLWWEYQRGAGYTSSVAVKNLADGASWDNNFFSEEILDRHGNPRYIDYRKADSNGTVMRVAPLAIALRNRPEDLKTAVWLSAVTSHGNPGAALAAELHAETVASLMRDPDQDLQQLTVNIRKHLDNASIPDDPIFDNWKARWESDGSNLNQAYARAKRELYDGLDVVDRINQDGLEDVMDDLQITVPPHKTRAIPAWLGGLATVIAYDGDGQGAIIDATNRLGSDTDTLAAVAGTMCGARDGGQSRPDSWDSGVQDADYIARVASDLHAVAAGTATQNPGSFSSPSSLPSVSDGLREWGLVKGTRVSHPIFGAGTVTKARVRQMDKAPANYLANVHFDCGQTCRFRSDDQPAGFVLPEAESKD